jgi:hypothetical protein
MDFALVVAIVVGFIAGYATCGVLTAMNYWVDSYAKPPVARGMRPTEPSPRIDGPIANPAKQSRGAVYQPAPVPRILYANDNPNPAPAGPPPVSQIKPERCHVTVLKPDASEPPKQRTEVRLKPGESADLGACIVISGDCDLIVTAQPIDPGEIPGPPAPPPAPPNQTITKGG